MSYLDLKDEKYYRILSDPTQSTRKFLEKPRLESILSKKQRKRLRLYERHLHKILKDKYPNYENENMTITHYITQNTKLRDSTISTKYLTSTYIVDTDYIFESWQ